MKKKYLCGGVILVLIVICIIYATTIISKDAETGNLIIRHNLFSDYTYEICDDHIKLIFYNNANAKKVVIPDTILGKPVTEIGEYCFSTSTYDNFMIYDRKFETVQMGKNIRTIEKSAFMGCESLKEVLGNIEIEIIERAAFEGCSNLRKVEFAMNRVEDYAFEGCVSLQKINTNSELTYIGEDAFSPCRPLTDIGSQKHLEYIGNKAFRGSSLTEFEANDDIKFGYAVFQNTPFLNEQFQYINNGVLMKCIYEGEKNYLVLPEGITSVDLGSVYGDASKIEEIYIPDSVTEIKGYILDEDNKNVTYYIPSSVVSIGFDYDDGTHMGLNYEAGKIVTTEGAYAQQYAKDHEIPCEIVDHIEMPEE